jgi:hypothetical protein
MPEVIGPVKARWSSVVSTGMPRFAMTKSGTTRRLAKSAIAAPVRRWGTVHPVVGQWRHGQLMRMVVSESTACREMRVRGFRARGSRQGS